MGREAAPLTSALTLPSFLLQNALYDFFFPLPRELGGFAVWCKKGPVSKSSPPPVPKPRSISLGLKQLSLQPDADSEQKYVCFKRFQSYLDLAGAGNSSCCCHLVVLTL